MINLLIRKKDCLIFQKRAVIFVIFIIFSALHSTAQDALESEDIFKQSKKTEKADNDSVIVHDPTKATLYSMVLPGLGQAYNRKYWKIPIVYVGFGVCAYFISFNNKEYQAWRDAYYHAVNNTDQSEPPVNEYEERYWQYPSIMKDQKDYYRRNRDLSYIFTGIWYLLNIVDAAVDAHLYTWEVDEKLSLKFEPAITQPVYGYRPNGGLRVTLNFK